ncbi:MAG: HAMP domain-containing histidine kinase [Clostridiales bacterium]|nr:HAMP domain-containing histidine kinase [Clostridiales bacterium]
MNKNKLKPGNRTPKIQKVKKPKFLTEFLKWSLIFLLITSFVSWQILFRVKKDAEDEIYRTFESYTDNLQENAKEFFALDESDPSYSYVYNRLEFSLNMFTFATGRYAAVYDGDEMIMESVSGISAVFGTQGEDGKLSDFYILKDASYLKPVQEYKNGKYDLAENLAKAQKYNYDPLSMLALVFGEKFYSLDFEDVYIDQQTHRFVPGMGKVEKFTMTEGVAELDGSSTVRIDCTPSDTTGYTHLERYDLRLLVFSYTEDTGKDVNYWIGEDQSTFVDPDPDVYIPPEDAWTCSWSVRVSYVNPEAYSVWEILPVTTRVCFFGAIGSGLLLGLLVAVIVYHKKKTLWNTFEYRRKTTEAMAHDLKTPLATISAYAESLEEGLEGQGASAGSAEQARRIRENVSEMNRMLENILDFSRTDAGVNRITISDVDVTKLLNESLARFEKLFAEKELKLERKGRAADGAPCFLKTDAELFKQSVENLVSNCAKYSDPGSTIEIDLFYEQLSFKNKTSVSVSDVEDLKKPFVKGDASRGENGTGLGLSIVDSNLRALGYKLELKLLDGWFSAIVHFT